MKNKKIVWIILLILMLVLFGASVLYKDLSSKVENDTSMQSFEETEEEYVEETEQEATVVAPDFTVIDAEGNEVKLSDLRGMPVIVNFWASWCGPCKSEMPDFQEVYELYGDKIQLMMVNLTDGSRETVESAGKHVEEQGYTFPVYYDTEMSAAIAYGVQSIPVTYFIDAEGTVVCRGMGALDKETLQQGIDMVYAE